MKNKGKPSLHRQKIPGEVFEVDLTFFEPTLIEKEKHSGDIFTPVILRLCDKALKAGGSVVLLSRTNDIPWYIDYGKKKYKYSNIRAT